MAGYTQAEQQATLDARHPTSGNTDHIAYSTNGTTEFAGLARTPIGATGWSAATAATPSVKGNANALTSAAASSGGTITHTAIYSALTAGTQRTDWTPAAASKTVAVGDQITHAANSVQITLD
jgi:hypothetical protein